MLNQNKRIREAVFSNPAGTLSLRFGLAIVGLALATQPALAHVEAMDGGLAADVASPDVAVSAGSFEDDPNGLFSGHVDGDPAYDMAYRPFVDFLTAGDLADVKFFYAAGLIEIAVEPDGIGASAARFESGGDASQPAVEPAEGSSDLAIERPTTSGTAMSRYIAWWILGK